MGTVYFLVIMYASGYGNSLTSFPVGDLQECQQAAQEAKKLEGFASGIKTVCIRGVLK